jgi:hypothetical protein
MPKPDRRGGVRKWCGPADLKAELEPAGGRPRAAGHDFGRALVIKKDCIAMKLTFSPFAKYLAAI